MLGLLTLDWPRLRDWQRRPEAFGEAEFKRLLDSGINVFHPAVEPNAPEPHRAARRWAADWNSLLDSQARYLLPVRAAADLDRAHLEGRVGIVVGFQSCEHFRTLEDVALFHGLGQRVSQLTYNGRSRLGSGCKDPRDGGLSAFGGEVIEAMNGVGMAVDVSHCSERTTLEAITASRRPVLVTHANCRALAPHARNKSDAAIRALARRGGVMGVTAVRAFVRLGEAPTLEHLLDHYQHVARLTGVEHVGIGSDCDLDALHPETGTVRPAYEIDGLRHHRRVFDLAEGLLRRGFSERDVELVLGGNFRRALTAIWAPA
jgi:membrane dipeptidase